MRTILYRFSLAFFFLYICSIYICSYNTELYTISNAIFVMLFGVTMFYIMLRGSLIFLKGMWLMMIYWAVTVASYYWIITDINVIQSNVTMFLLMLFVLVITNILIEEKNIDTALKMLYFAGIAMCLYSLFVYGYESTMQALLAESNIRLGREINQENIFGMVCATSAVVGLYFAFYKGQGIYYFITLIPIVYAFTSGSRKVIIILAVALVILIANKRGKSFISTVLIWLFSILAVVFIINYLTDLNLLIFSRFDSFINVFGEQSMTNVADNSSMTRMTMIKSGIKWFLQKPFFGYGTGQYAVLYFENFGVYTYSHSTVIEVLVNHGLVGFIAYYSLYYYMLVRIIRAVKRKLENSVAILLVFSILIVMNLFSVMLSEKMPYILIGIILSYIGINREKLQKQPEAAVLKMKEGEAT